MREPTVGARVERTWTVEQELSADRWGNEGVHVLSTPALGMLFEHACMDIAAPLLEEGEFSVGASLRIRHTAPTPVGMQVTVKATLAKASGTRLDFDVTAADEVGPVGEGEHTRAVLPRTAFEQALAGRTKPR